MTNETFADELKRIRDRGKWTQRECAEKVPGLSVRTLESWESARVNTPLWVKVVVLRFLQDRLPQAKRNRNRAGLSKTPPQILAVG